MMDKKTNNYGFYSIFPTLLRNLMSSRKITQEEVARFCGVQRQTIAQWKDGKTRPDIIDLEHLATLFHVSADYLLGLPKQQADENESANDTVQRDILKEISNKAEGFAIQWLLNEYRLQEEGSGATEKSLLSLLGTFFQIAGYDPACPDLILKLENNGHLRMVAYDKAAPKAERNIETHIKGLNKEYSFTDFILQQIISDIDKTLHSRAQHETLTLEYARKSPVKFESVAREEDPNENP